MKPHVPLTQDAVTYRDAAALARAFLHVNLTPLQAIIARRIAWSEVRRFNVRGMTQWGKTLGVAAGVGLRILLREVNPAASPTRVAVVDPTIRQSQVLRGYMADFLVQSPDFAALLDLGSTGGVDRLDREVSKTKLTFKRGSLSEFLSCEGDAQRLMGLGGYDLVVEDEAGLIQDETHRTRITRMMAKGGMFVKVGNPWTKPSHFHSSTLNPAWENLKVTWRDALREGRVESAFLDEQRAALTDSEWQVLYESEFPDVAEDQLIPSSWIERAIVKRSDRATADVILEDAKTEWGLDVAAGGLDETVLTKVARSGGKWALEKQWGWSTADTMRTADRVHAICGSGATLKGDENGVGNGVIARLRDLGVNATGFSAGRTARDKDRFTNLASEALWNLRSLLERELLVLVDPDPALIADLGKWRWSLIAGRVKVDVAGGKGGGNSPDRGDSLAMALWAPFGDQRPRVVQRGSVLI